MTKTAIIVGSSGLTGSHLLRLLLGSEIYGKVISLVRKPSHITDPKLEEHIIDFDDIDSYKDFIHGDDMFCCLGTTIRKAGSKDAFRKVDLTYPIQLAWIASERGIKQLLIISSIGANPKSGNFYLRTKGEYEEELKNIPFKSTAILRPSLLLGNRPEFRLGERISAYVMETLSFILPSKYKPIKSEDVAKAMCSIAQKELRGNNIYETETIKEFAAKRN